MIIVRNKYIPVKDYTAMCVWPFIFVRSDKTIRNEEVVMNHEKIHARQQAELLLVFFYIVYFIFWLIGLIKFRNRDDAYRQNPFEREAYGNQYYMRYLEDRKHYSWINYI